MFAHPGWSLRAWTVSVTVDKYSKAFQLICYCCSAIDHQRPVPRHLSWLRNRTWLRLVVMHRWAIMVKSSYYRKAGTRTKLT